MEPTKVSGGKSKYSQLKSNLLNPISKEDTHDSRGYELGRKDKDHQVGIVHPYVSWSAENQYITPAFAPNGTQITNWTNRGTLTNQLTAIAASSSVIYTEQYQIPLIRFGAAVPAFQIAASTALFNFIHLAGGEYSIYCVIKNTVGENDPGTKSIAINNASTANRGFQLSIINDGNERRIGFQVGNNSTQVFQRISGNYSATDNIYTRTAEYPPFVISILCRNINQVGALCGAMYVNGIADASLITRTTFGVGDAATNFFIGDLSVGGGDLNSSVGDLAIYNVMHDQTTHNYIVQGLKEKYRI